MMCGSTGWQDINSNHFVCKKNKQATYASSNGEQKQLKQESPAVAGKPARRESMPKIASIRRPYNVVADNAGLSSFV